MISYDQIPPIKIEISGKGYVRWPEGKQPAEAKDSPK